MKFPCQHVWLCIQHDIVTAHSLEIFSQLFLMVWLKYPTFFTLPVHREVKLINRSGAKKKTSRFIYWRMTLHHWLPHSLSICIGRCLQLFSMCVLLWYWRIPSHQPFWIATTTLYPKISVIGGIGFLLLNLVKNTQRLPKSVNWLQISDLMLLPIALFQLCNQLYRLFQLFCSVLLLNCFLFLLLEWSS